MERPNCANCKHFYVTWDQRTPRGCKLYGIESRPYPSVLVMKNTAEGTCLGYEKKPKPKERDAYS